MREFSPEAHSGSFRRAALRVGVALQTILAQFQTDDGLELPVVAKLASASRA